ncbi:LOW QUALITY PROTEIN: aladin-like [Ruditapes philippinarum]|uniref:LOW QUALITY PROTEIN: aladin-like n=1 Tax=Ruditapes philippinarum TaxID=129788 RepID=UPI00295B3DBA|nr:LOW QUALITY PROTEIN: aladin-like [Ruditapes philippinarum]
MTSTSILKCFPPAPGKGQITVFEQIGELSSVPQDQAKLKFQGYPDVAINKDNTRSLTQRENAKSAFLPHDETVSKRVYHAWQDMGVSGALEEIVNDAEQVPNWISAIAQKLLVLSRWTGSLHGSFFPHLALSNEDIVSRFSSVVHWTVSPIKAFAWHPHTLKFSYTLKDDTVRVHANFTELASSLKHTELVPILEHKLQKNVSCLAWQPNSSSVLAVGCQSCILIWHVEPTSLATRPSSSSVQVLQESGHCPITSLSWSPDGRILMSSSPVDTAMMAWDVALETCTPLCRFGGGGVSLVAWSPDGSKLFSATLSNLFRVWETRTWSCEKWSTSTGPCKTACWSPKGNILLFATENQPVIYSLTFSEVSDETKPVIGGSQTAMACADLSETDLQTADSSNVKVGGLIQHMAWDSKGERLAVIFQGNCEYVAVFRTKLFPVLEITSCGFVKGFDGEKAEFIEFQPNYSKGAMLTVIWSSGRVGYVPMYFVSSSSTTTVSSLEEEFKYQQHQHTFSNGLYSTTD